MWREVLTATRVKIAVFQDTAPCSLEETNSAAFQKTAIFNFNVNNCVAYKSAIV